MKRTETDPDLETVISLPFGVELPCSSEFPRSSGRIEKGPLICSKVDFRGDAGESSFQGNVTCADSRRPVEISQTKTGVKAATQ